MYVINHRLLERNLIPGLLQCATMIDRKGREDVVARLRDDLRDHIHRRDANLSDAANIVMTCADYPNGLQELVKSVAFYEQQSFPMGEVHRIWVYVQKITGLTNKYLRKLVDIFDLAQVEDLHIKRILGGLRNEFKAISPMPSLPLVGVLSFCSSTQELEMQTGDTPSP